MDHLTTLADMLVINGVSLADMDISDVVLAGTFIKNLHAQESSNGHLHEFSKETSAPVVGFRQIGKSSNNRPGQNELVQITLKLLDATAREDKALADIYKKGPEAFMARRALRNMQVGFSTAEKQMIYGTGNDADGYLGLVDSDLFKYANSERVINAGGSGDGLQSVYVVCTGEDKLSVVYNGDSPLTIGDMEEVAISSYDENDKADGQFSGYQVSIMSHLGIQITSKYTILRVANIDPQSASIEDRIQDALAEFPGGYSPTHILASRKIRRALQRNRQSYNPAGTPAQPVMDIDGVPVEITEALVDESAIGNAP